MGSMSKVLVDELIIGVVDNSHDDWGKKAICTRRVWLTLLDKLEVDLVKIVFANYFDG